MGHKTSITFDEPSEEVLRRHVAHGDKSAYVRAAVIEKAARDEGRDALAAIRARLDDHERRIAALEADAG